jgi:hypothetical protein
MTSDSELRQACVSLMKSVYVGDGKIVCPNAMLEPIRAIYNALRKEEPEAPAPDAELRRGLGELAEKWRRRVTLAEYDARMAGPGSTLVAVHKHTASSVRECKRELEALLAKGARL